MAMRQAFCIAILALFTCAQAQTLSGVQLAPAQVKVGEPVKITVNFEPTELSNCALRVHFGDGQVQKYTVSKISDMPLVITRAYDKPGQYKVDIEPTTAGVTLKCLGKRTDALLTVAPAQTVAAGTATVAQATPTVAPVTVSPSAPAAATTSVAVPSAAAAAGKPTLCPDGWTLAKPGQNAKTRAFSCSAKAGTKIPEPRLNCPGELTYFENIKKGQLGCRI
jgi:hypothetical protein